MGNDTEKDHGAVILDRRVGIMNRKLLLQVTVPSVLIGLVLFAACLVSGWFTLQSQHNLTRLLSQEVASMQAAQELQICVRQLRFRDFLNVMDPVHARQRPIDDARGTFERALDKARQVAGTARERKAVDGIAEGYYRYQRDLALLHDDVATAGARPDLHRLFDVHPIRYVDDPCQELVRINEEEIAETVRQSDQLGYWVRLTLVGLGVVGPLSGLLAGFGIARGLSRSIYRLSVRVQDMAKHLDRKVASVTLPANGDLKHLDKQLQYVIQRVEEASENWQRHQRQMLRAEQLAAVGQLAAGVAHEVRNPLTSIKLLVEAARRPNHPSPLTAEDLAVMHSEIERLEQLVQAFLDFARPPAAQRREGDFREVIGQAVELVRARARQQSINLEVGLPVVPCMVKIDCGQFRTVLVNLFLNALDAMPNGGRLEVMLEAKPADELVLTVVDTGTGIAPHMLQRLFTPFASGKPTGTGLGLSICKRIVEEHNGRITGGNRPDGGACFALGLPVLIGEEIHANSAGH
jgi:two-component system, NtrC family, sensor histidine kinase HydH